MEIVSNFNRILRFLLSLGIALLLICPSSATTVATIMYTKNLTPIDNTTYAKTAVAKTSSDWINASVGLPASGGYYNVVLGDVNKDGYLDIIYCSGQSVANGVRAMIGNGGSSWVSNSTGLPTTEWYTDIAISDLNNDGNLDFVVGNYSGSGVYLGNGGAGGSMVWTRKNAPRSWNGVALGDVNNDTILDIATGFDGVWVNTSNGGAGGTFVWSANSTGLETSGLSFYGVAFGDINNDGNLDLVGAIDEIGGGIRAWRGNGGAGGSMIWTNVTANLPLTGVYTGICLADVNKDGNLDIIAGGGHGGAGVWVWTGNGGAGGSFVWTANSTGLPTGGDYYQVAAGDLNGDGNIDIVAANDSLGGVELWEGNGGIGGAMIWTKNSTGLPIGNCIDVCLGDVNKDGKLDIAATFDGQGVRVLLNNKTFPSVEFTFNLDNGWNFITMPLNNTTYKRAEDLAQAMPNCTYIARWNTTTSSFEDHKKDTDTNNFTIDKGVGYFVYVSNSSIFKITGTALSSVEIVLTTGWNSIGRFNSTTIYASDLAASIGPNCIAVAYWNMTLMRFITHPINTDISNFPVERGKGYLVYVTSDVTWTNK